MDTAAEIGRNLASKYEWAGAGWRGLARAGAGRYGQTSLTRPNSQVQIGAGNIDFSCPPDHEQDLATLPG